MNGVQMLIEVNGDQAHAYGTPYIRIEDAITEVKKIIGTPARLRCLSVQVRCYDGRSRLAHMIDRGPDEVSPSRWFVVRADNLAWFLAALHARNGAGGLANILGVEVRFDEANDD